LLSAAVLLRWVFISSFQRNSCVIRALAPGSVAWCIHHGILKVSNGLPHITWPVNELPGSILSQLLGDPGKPVSLSCISTVINPSLDSFVFPSDFMALGTISFLFMHHCSHLASLN
jgi:hypothetical protein